VIVNIGFLIDYIAGFEGNLDERVPLPEFQVKHWLGPQFQKLPYPLPMEEIKYPPWTYRDLKTLGEEFRRQAAERYGINDFKFGSLLLGRHDDYNASGGGWRDAHPEIWDQRKGETSEAPLNVCRSLHGDRHIYAAFPAGIPEGTPFPHFFAQQWGAVSRAVKFDALVLRDGMWSQIEYLKIGPFGDHASPDPQQMECWHQAIAALVRESKQANPDCLLLGYSNAVSPVSEWRLDGFDLERIAKEGYLDAWIDQSWGGAWNEYWNTHLIGYSFQLANILGHAAQLADTPTRHYVLVDTWDAYEPWDTLHSVPEKMKSGPSCTPPSRCQKGKRFRAAFTYPGPITATSSGRLKTSTTLPPMWMPPPPMRSRPRRRWGPRWYTTAGSWPGCKARTRIG
jgi:hypothetical protein